MEGLKIIIGKRPYETKIYQGEEEITSKIGGLFGIDIKIRVDEIPEITLHRYGLNSEITIDNCNLNIKNYEPKKVDGADVILEDTDFINAKNGRHYINKN